MITQPKSVQKLSIQMHILETYTQRMEAEKGFVVKTRSNKYTC